MNSKSNKKASIENAESIEIIENDTPAELEKKVTDTIVALVNRANAVAAESVFVEDHVKYEVGQASAYIDKTDEKANAAKQKYDELKNLPDARFYTVGRNKKKVELTQEVLLEIIDAVDNNANATKALFNNQAEMAKYSKLLYAIGIMGIASNRMVVREIKLRLEQASKEELSDLARRELESVIYELKMQQALEEKVDEVKDLVEKNHTNVLASIENSKKQISDRLDEEKKNREELSGLVEKNHTNVLASIENTKKQISDRLDEEKKNFLDTAAYKMLIGILALGALIISLLSF